MKAQNKSNFLSEMLKSKFITPSNQLLLLNYCKKWRVSQFQSVLDTKLMSEYELAEGIARVNKLGRVYNIQNMRVSKSLYENLSFEFLYDHYCTPVSKLTIGAKVAIANPYIEDVEKYFSEHFPKRVKFVIGEASDIRNALHKNFPIDKRIQEYI